jgi:hypothetical protein
MISIKTNFYTKVSWFRLSLLEGFRGEEKEEVFNRGKRELVMSGVIKKWNKKKNMQGSVKFCKSMCSL